VCSIVTGKQIVAVVLCGGRRPLRNDGNEILFTDETGVPEFYKNPTAVSKF
jgi:hypothetical protein